MVQGVLLAAGAGRRMGGPKSLVRAADGTPWLVRSVRVLVDGGCDAVTVVLGAEADRAARLLEGAALERVDVIVADDWADGMGASLRTGLGALDDGSADAALVHLVDLPDVGAEVVARMLADGAGADTLARAAYAGEPGHPVLLGRDHWGGVASAAEGDRGARAYLDQHVVRLVECGDLATGHDVDTR
jgi:molybdenum cofactor cytidylyltransferase/nicotine blue oxidoreductase